MPGKFSLEQEEINSEIRVIHVNGYLDAHTFQMLDDVILSFFDEGVYKIAVNLENVNYISSAGAGVFIGAHGPAVDNGGDIVLVNPTENVIRVFDLLGITRLFTVVKNVDDAIDIFS